MEMASKRVSPDTKFEYRAAMECAGVEDAMISLSSYRVSMTQRAKLTSQHRAADSAIITRKLSFELVLFYGQLGRDGRTHDSRSQKRCHCLYT
jgi:hypothetical protein